MERHRLWLHRRSSTHFSAREDTSFGRPPRVFIVSQYPEGKDVLGAVQLIVASPLVPTASGKAPQLASVVEKVTFPAAGISTC